MRCCVVELVFTKSARGLTKNKGTPGKRVTAMQNGSSLASLFLFLSFLPSFLSLSLSRVGAVEGGGFPREQDLLASGCVLPWRVYFAHAVRIYRTGLPACTHQTSSGPGAQGRWGPTLKYPTQMTEKRCLLAGRHRYQSGIAVHSPVQTKCAKQSLFTSPRTGQHCVSSCAQMPTMPTRWRPAWKCCTSKCAPDPKIAIRRLPIT